LAGALHPDDVVAGKRSKRRYGSGGLDGGAVVGAAVVGGAVVGGAVVGGAVVGGAVVGAVVGRGTVVVGAGVVVVRRVVVVVAAGVVGVVGVVVAVVMGGSGVDVVGVVVVVAVGLVVRGVVGAVDVTPGRETNVVDGAVELAVEGTVLSLVVSDVEDGGCVVCALFTIAADVDGLAVDDVEVFVVADVVGCAPVVVVVSVPPSRRAIADAFPSVAMRRRGDVWPTNGSRKMPTVCSSATVNTTIATAATELNGNRDRRPSSEALTRTNWLSFDMRAPFKRTFEHELGWLRQWVVSPPEPHTT
jgi:hypothetical protein